MKQQQTQIKKKPNNKKKRSGFLTNKLKKFTHYFFDKDCFCFSKNATIEGGNLKKEKIKWRKSTLFLVNTLIFVFMLLMEQRLINFFRVKNKKRINKKEKYQKNMALFIETCYLFFHSKTSWGTK